MWIGFWDEPKEEEEHNFWHNNVRARLSYIIGEMG